MNYIYKYNVFDLFDDWTWKRYSVGGECGTKQQLPAHSEEHASEVEKEYENDIPVQSKVSIYVLMMISHYFHFINDQDMTYLCLTDKIFSKRAAFAYLEDIKEIFCLNYSPDARLNSIPMGM